MYRLFVLLCGLVAVSAFVDENFYDFERRQLLEKGRQEVEEQAHGPVPTYHRFYRSIPDADSELSGDLYDINSEPLELVRFRRSQLPGAVGGNIERDGDNTIGTINVGHKTDKYDVGATWSKVIRGPNRGKPNFSIGGTYRW